MGVSFHPNTVLDARKITVNAGASDDNQLITGTLKHGALTQPTLGSVTLDLYPCVRIWQVEIGNVYGIWC